MKKIVISVMLLGLAGLAYTQEPVEKIKPIELEGVIVKPPNFEYLASVQDMRTPPVVKVLERKAAYYDLENSPVYDDSYDAYEVIFSNSKGRVIATYDENGKILRSYEKFKNTPVPAPIKSTVNDAYPEWKINKHTYVVSYYRDKSVKKTYHFQIEKDNKKKNLKMTWKGMR